MVWPFGDSRLKEMLDLESKLTGSREEAARYRRRIVEVALDGMTKAYVKEYGEKAELHLKEMVKTDRIDSRSLWALFERFGKTYKSIGKLDILVGVSADIWIMLEKCDIRNASPEMKRILFEAMQQHKESCRNLGLYHPL